MSYMARPACHFVCGGIGVREPPERERRGKEAGFCPWKRFLSGLRAPRPPESGTGFWEENRWGGVP